MSLLRSGFTVLITQPALPRIRDTKFNLRYVRNDYMTNDQQIEWTPR